MKLRRYEPLPRADRWKPGKWDECTNPEQYALCHLVTQLFPDLEPGDATYVTETLLAAAKAQLEEHERTYYHNRTPE